MSKLKVLFVCEENRLRSKTAAEVYSSCPTVEVKSAGLSPTAEIQVSADLLDWADKVFVMEKRQRNKIHKLFPELYARKSITCLYIPDDYDFMDPILVTILRNKLPQYIGSPEGSNSVKKGQPKTLEE